MNPTINDRITAMIATLERVVAPALEGQDFAADQLNIVLRHLHVLRGQEPFVAEFEKLRWVATADYARGLLTLIPAQTPVYARLAEAIGKSPPVTLVEVRQSTRAILDAVSVALSEAWNPQPADVASAVIALTRSYEASDAYLGRVFFQGFGFEDGTEDLPSVADFLAKQRGAIG